MLSRCRCVYFNWFICNFIWKRGPPVRSDTPKKKEKKWKRIINWNVKTIRWRKTVRAFIHRWLPVHARHREWKKEPNDVWSNLLNSSSHDDRHKTIQTERRKREKLSMKLNWEWKKNKEKHGITRLLFITLFGFWIFFVWFQQRNRAAAADFAGKKGEQNVGLEFWNWFDIGAACIYTTY